MSKPKILVFAGSARQASFNKKLAKAAAEHVRTAGAEATFIDLRDFPMPLYDGDLEDTQGLPEKARELKKLMLEHDGLLIASPEYNSSITPLLKNVIDWASRTESDDEPSLQCFKGKVACLMSTSPGALGGLRGLVALRSILGNIGVLVLPEQLAVPKSQEAFQDNGSLKDSKQDATVQAMMSNLVNILKKIKA